MIDQTSSIHAVNWVSQGPSTISSTHEGKPLVTKVGRLEGGSAIKRHMALEEPIYQGDEISLNYNRKLEKQTHTQAYSPQVGNQLDIYS